MNTLLEATYKQLRKKTQKQKPEIVERSKRVTVQYRGIEKGKIKFRTISLTTPGQKFWDQEIKLVLPGKRKTSKATIYNSLKKDIKVKCGCPAFRYWGFQYILGGLGSLIGRRPKAPKKRNPKKKGALCKHLYQVLGVLPANVSKIVRDIKNKGE